MADREARSQELGFIIPRRFWIAQCLTHTGTQMEHKVHPDLRDDLALKPSSLVLIWVTGGTLVCGKAR